ncbi:hypothetical protein [Dictyobacter kobayashii]|uniref:Uncharacterized protein n=1 Tax=Dictyobacter kobayashii TaxID=2014872 RepID=A0A402AXT9_9CHLR|nr:hypothetical protein [Dictyobacter kobayashii]GCE23951.1 hypothetical protein KDK_77510 [Dictyobacter kobayashii]
MMSLIMQTPATVLASSTHSIHQLRQFVIEHAYSQGYFMFLFGACGDGLGVWSVCR